MKSKFTLVNGRWLLVPILLMWLFWPSLLGPSQLAMPQRTNHPDRTAYVVFSLDLDSRYSAAIWSSQHQPLELTDADLQHLEILFQQKIVLYNQESYRNWNKMLVKYPKANWSLSEFIIQPKQYVRQYIPALNNLGEKEVWVNCHCEVSSYWREAPLFVRDGGNCHFSMYINLTRSHVYRFVVNGVA